MEIEFDPAKDAANRAKHGRSLAQAAEMTDLIAVPDDRFRTEERYRVYGLLDGVPHCAAVTMRADTVRVINFRRAHLKEYRRYAR